MRIAVITSSYPRFPGDGTAPFVKSICEHLVKASHQVDVVAPYDPEIKPIETNGVGLYRFKYIWPDHLHILGHARSLKNDSKLRPLSFFLLPFFLLSAFWNLLLITSKQKSQVIYAHWVIPNGLVAAWVSIVRGIPFILSLHGSDIFVAKKNFLFSACARWIFRRASFVTACSPELFQSAVSMGARDKTSVIAWGADPTIFYPERRELSKSNRSEIPDDTLVIATLGRMVQKKGFDILLEAFPAILRAEPRTKLIIGGDGVLKNELQSQVSRLGITNNVTFPGTLHWNEVPDFLAQADIFVLPSVRDPSGNLDGLPTVLLEAMSSGCAIVASNIGGVSLVIEHEKNGLLVPPGSVDALTNAILDLISDQQKRILFGRSARQSVVDRHNWVEVTKKISDILAEAVETSNKLKS